METSLPVAERPRRPEWMKVRAPSRRLAVLQRPQALHGQRLHTICEEARCPNIAECWGRGTATFQILGDTCTRACRYCYVNSGKPESPPDPLEPLRLAHAAAQMELRHVVVTSVDRDDLPDKGAAHYAATIRALKAKLPDASVEVLTPDFLGYEEEALQIVLGARPEVFNHNIETVRRLHRRMRGAKASYDKALWLLRRAKEVADVPGAHEVGDHRRPRRDERRGGRHDARPPRRTASTSSRSASTSSRRRSTRRSTAGCTPTSSAGSASRARRSASARSSRARSSARATAPTSNGALPKPASAPSRTEKGRAAPGAALPALPFTVRRTLKTRRCTASQR